MILLLMPIAYADYNYTSIGYPDKTFRSKSNSVWNSIDLENFNWNEADDVYYYGLGGQGKKAPLVADLNNDGQDEIITLEGYTLRVYHYYTGLGLRLNSSLAMRDTPYDYYSNIEIFDFDDDGTDEIITIEAGFEQAFIMFYNSSGLFNKTSIDLSATINGNTPQIVINCGAYFDGSYFLADNDSARFCYGLYIHNLDGTDNDVHALIFNYDGSFQSSPNIDSDSGAHIKCLSRIPELYVGNIDYDADGSGEIEILYTYIEASPSGTDYLNVGWFKVNETGQNSGGDSLAINMGNVIDGATDCRTTPSPADKFTSAVAHDFIPDARYKEIVVGYSYDDGLVADGENEFMMKLYDMGFDEQGSFPEYTNLQYYGDGQIVSNVMIGNFIEGSTAYNDFCIMGFDNSDNEFDLVCGGWSDYGGAGSVEYFLNGEYNDVNNTFDMYQGMVHAIESRDTTSGSGNLNEVLTSVGVMYLTDAKICSEASSLFTYAGANYQCMGIYQTLGGNGSIIPVATETQADGNSYDDLIMITNNALIYIDDGWYNREAYLSDYTLAPCTEHSWKISDANDDNVTRIGYIRYAISDDDSDNVGSRATLYYGQTYNQSDGWLEPYVQGAYQEFWFEINHSITQGILRIEYNDTGNPDTVNYEDIQFTAGLNGVEYTDCTTEYEAESEELTEEEQEQAELVANNTITNTMNALKDAVGLRLANSVIWLMVMAVVGGILAYQGFSTFRTHPMQVLAVVGIVEVILFFIGIALEFISVIYLWITLIIALAILSFKAREYVTGG